MNTNSTKPKGTFAKLMQTAPLPSQPVVKPQQEVKKMKPETVEMKTEAKPHENKKLLGARITPKQYAVFKKLYIKLNTNEVNFSIDKGEIVGLTIETLSDLLEQTTEDFPTVNKLKSYLVNKLTRIKGS